MTENTRRLILRLARFQRDVDEAERLMAEAYDKDSEFDGGEFSGPALWRGFEREQDRLAQRFGFANADVAYDVMKMLGAGIPQPAILHGFAAPLPA